MFIVLGRLVPQAARQASQAGTMNKVLFAFRALLVAGLEPTCVLCACGRRAVLASSRRCPY